MRKVRERGGPAITNRFESARIGEVFASTEAWDEWKAEKVTLERDIAMKQERLERVNMRLRAAGQLTDGDSLEGLSGEAQLPNGAKPLAPGNRLRLIEAIEKIANESPHPVSKAELRQHLCAMGLPLINFNNYFYTAIRRLKSKQRVGVLDDGSVWKAPSIES